MWRAWVAVGVAAMALVGCGGEATDDDGGDSIPSAAVAVVAGEPVAQSDLETFVRVPLGTHMYSKYLLESYPDVGECARLLREARVAPRDETGQLFQGESGLTEYCDKEFQKARTGTMGFLLNRAVTDRIAQDAGVSLSDSELRRIILEDVGSPEQLATNIDEAGIGEDVLELPRVDALSERLEDHLATEVAGPLTERAVTRYARAHPEVLRIPERRRVRFIVTASGTDADAARHAIRVDGWEASAERYATKGTSRRLGGRPVVLSEPEKPDGALEAMFAAPLNRIEGPQKIDSGWLIFEAISSSGGGRLSGAAARQAARAALQDERSRRAHSEFEERRTVIERTIRCREGYVIPLCGANAEQARVAATP